jgi:DNA excision repair protein ERCC-3
VSSESAAIVQGDRSVLVEVDHPGYERARDVLVRCAEIEKSPEHVHTYRLSDLALWNAAAAGVTAEEILAGLRSVSRFALPGHVEHEIRERVGRHGTVVLADVPEDPTRLRLSVTEALLFERLQRDKTTAPFLDLFLGNDRSFLLRREYRGVVKQAIMKLGWPVLDTAGLTPGAPLSIEERRDVFTPYPYQVRAVQAFVDSGGHGVVVLPCGAGKTVIGLMAAARLGVRTLVITSSREACAQWRRELVSKSTLTKDQVALYDVTSKSVAPVTITTYSMLGRKGGSGPTSHTHFDRLAEEPWGLLIYDEVHLLPAPVFRLAAELQSRRRLGLTATLIREDGRAPDVFALIGPKRYDVPWRELEASGHVAAATCFETRLPLPNELHTAYATASAREQPRIAGENPLKLRLLGRIAERHSGDRVLVMGSYLDPLAAAGRLLDAPVITGETPHRDREKHYEAFRRGAIRRLVLSRVGNFAIDLPDANVLVQLSGTMGSRQEEAQRLGRVLRPKPGGASFYTLVTRDTIEQEHALHRQLFLTEQGYRYYIDEVEEADFENGHASSLH